MLSNNSVVPKDGFVQELDSVKPIIIKYVDAPAGSGKTYVAQNLLNELASNGKKVIYAAPTLALIDEVFAQFEVLSSGEYELNKFHGDSIRAWESVGSAAANWMNEISSRDYGKLVVLSHSALMQIISKNLVDDLTQWHLVVDEEFAGGVSSSGSFKVATEGALTHLFDKGSFTKNDADINSDITIRSGKKGLVNSIAKGKSQLEGYDSNKWKNLSDLIIDPLWQVNGKLVETRNHCELKYVSYLKPSLLAGFASVQLMSADLKDSLLYKLWKKDGVQFEPWGEWQKKKELSPNRQKPSGKHLVIYHLLKEGKEWRTYFLDEVGSRLKLGSNIVIKRILDQVLSDPLKVTTKKGWNILTVEPLLRVNKDTTEFLESVGRTLRPANDFELNQYRKEYGIPNECSFSFDVGSNTIDEYEPLPVNSAGLNAFKGSHKVVYLQTSMPNPHHEKWLVQKGGFNKQELRDSYYHAPMYQAVMRSSLRDPDNIDPKTVLVGDQGAAEYLLKRLQGAELRHCPIDILEESISYRKDNRQTRSDSGTGLSRSEKESMRKAREWFKKLNIEIHGEHGSDMFKNKHARNLAAYLKDLQRIYDIDLTDEAIEEYRLKDADRSIEGKGRKTAAKNMRKAILSLEISE